MPSVELEYEQIQSILVQELKWDLDNFRKLVKQSKPNVFDTDPETDKKAIRKMIKAYKKILAWYGVYDA